MSAVWHSVAKTRSRYRVFHRIMAGVVRLISASLPRREIGLACYAVTVRVTSRQTRKAASRASCARSTCS